MLPARAAHHLCALVACRQRPPRAAHPHSHPPTHPPRPLPPPNPAGRETLKELFSKGQLEGFHVSNYGRGHRATDYAKWFSTWLSYRIHYEEVRVFVCVCWCLRVCDV